MRAAVVKIYGPPENFELREWPDPTPKPGECLVRVRAVGINFADLLQRMGVYPGTPKPPFIPGFEVAGFIERAPTGATLRPGDRVVAMTRFNAYAEFAACPAEGTFAISDTLTFEQAAAIP